MKFCFQCGKVTPGEPLFCASCGRTYEVRLCPRLHVNSRYAKFCSQCGAEELSMPQPRVSLWWKAIAFLAKVFAGLLLVYVSMAFIASLLQRPETQAALVGIAILLGVLWGLWSLLPEWLQRLVRWCLRRNKENKHERKR
jgi:uncharacterized membrane protein YcjF (UPF0283 family)